MIKIRIIILYWLKQKRANLVNKQVVLDWTPIRLYSYLYTLKTQKDYTISLISLISIPRVSQFVPQFSLIGQVLFYFSSVCHNYWYSSGAKRRELQTLARFSPASVFLTTNILVFKVTVFLDLFAPFCKWGQSVFLVDVMGGKIIINLKQLH
jgi:hypothetical protein